MLLEFFNMHYAVLTTFDKNDQENEAFSNPAEYK